MFQNKVLQIKYLNLFSNNRSFINFFKVYKEDSEMISRGTTVSVGRIPLPRGEKKIWREDRVAKADLPVLTGTADSLFSGASGGGAVGSDGQPVKTEEERLQQIVDISGNEYGASNWERIRYSNFFIETKRLKPF